MGPTLGFLIFAGILGLLVFNKHRVIGVIAAVLLIDLVASTAYYNFIDKTMLNYEINFADGGWLTMGCEPNYRGPNGMEGGECSGSLLDNRDDYVKKEHLLTVGGWWSDGWVLGPNTFRPYFKWRF